MQPAPTDINALKSRMRDTWMAGDFGVIAAYTAEAAKDFAARLGIAAGAHVLDVACGTGNTAIPIARAGAIVTGVDIASNLLEQARVRAAKEGVKATFEEGDAEQLPRVVGEGDPVHGERVTAHQVGQAGGEQGAGGVVAVQAGVVQRVAGGGELGGVAKPAAVDGVQMPGRRVDVPGDRGVDVVQDVAGEQAASRQPSFPPTSTCPPFSSDRRRRCPTGPWCSSSACSSATRASTCSPPLGRTLPLRSGERSCASSGTDRRPRRSSGWASAGTGGSARTRSRGRSTRQACWSSPRAPRACRGS